MKVPLFFISSDKENSLTIMKNQEEKEKKKDFYMQFWHPGDKITLIHDYFTVHTF